MKIKPRQSVLIVADGPSAEVMRHAHVPQRAYIIAVNAVIQWIPRADAFFTLDPCMRQRVMMRNQRPGVRYFAAVPSDYGTPRAREKSHRMPREHRVTFLERVEGPGKFNAAPGMNDYRGKINTGNSAWGALGLAHHMKAQRVVIVGVDATSDVRVSGGRPNNLAHLPELFSTYDGPADIVNGSPSSAVDCFPRMSVNEAMQWLA